AARGRRSVSGIGSSNSSNSGRPDQWPGPSFRWKTGELDVDRGPWADRTNLSRRLGLGAGRFASLLQLADRFARFLEGEGERRQQAHAVVAAAGDQQVVVTRMLHELAVRRGELQA